MNVRSKNIELRDTALDILNDEHPMTLRQLFYRVVSAGVLVNDRPGYLRLGHLMTRLREAGDIPRTWIVDHVRATLKPSSWSGLADYADSVRECYRKNFWASLPHHVDVFVEKDAVAGTIQPVTEKYDINLRVLRGFSSVSFAGEIADEWGRIEKPIYAYYLGDFDPSGFDIERDIRKKIKQYCNEYVGFSWERLGVVADDFADWDLIPLKAKKTDTRYRRFVEEHGPKCAELDAIPPTELRRRVEAAITDHIDVGRWERLQRIEEAEQSAMQDYVDKLASVKVGLDTLSA